jgi:hypothetical protein
MRNLVALLLVSTAVCLAAPALAADLPQAYTPPPVDNGLGGTFYLRASVGGNLLWTNQHVQTDGTTNQATAAGYGYSFGAGFGYEVGNGLRADVTVDQLSNDGLTDGTYALHLRSTIALANAYYDFPLMGSDKGGLGGYVGAGLGGAYYSVNVTPGASNLPDGTGWTAAGALMAGVTYDMGAMVGDLGYRAIYMPQLSNNAVGPTNTSYYLNGNIAQEVRATLRYRLN